jgi:hypothetical protein
MSWHTVTWFCFCSSASWWGTNFVATHHIFRDYAKVWDSHLISQVMEVIHQFSEISFSIYIIFSSVMLNIIHVTLHIWVGKLFKCLSSVHSFLSESKFLTTHEVSVTILPTLIRIWCTCPLLWNFTISSKTVIIKGKRHNLTSQRIVSEWLKLQLWNKGVITQQILL